MDISISDLLPFLACEYRGATRLKLQRWTPPTEPMHLGTLLHAYVAKLLQTGQPDHTFGPPGIGLEPLIEAADRALLPIPWVIHGVEEPLYIQLGQTPHRLIGRLDARVSHPQCDEQDRQYQKSLQIKTFGKGQNLGNFLEKVRMSPHEISYRTMMRAAGHDCDGTLLLVFRTYLTKQQKADNVPIFESFDLQATHQEDKEAFKSIERQALNLITAPTHGFPQATKNWAACFNLLGNCPLIQHCHHGADAGDCLPFPLSNRYEDLPTNPTPAAR